MSDLLAVRTVVCTSEDPADAVVGPTAGLTVSTGPDDHAELDAPAGAGGPAGHALSGLEPISTEADYWSIKTALVTMVVFITSALPEECTNIRLPPRDNTWWVGATDFERFDLFANKFRAYCLEGLPNIGGLYTSFFPQSKDPRAPKGTYGVWWPGPSSFFITVKEKFKFLPIQDKISKIDIGSMLETLSTPTGRDELLDSFEKVFFKRVLLILGAQEVKTKMEFPPRDVLADIKKFEIYISEQAMLAKDRDDEIRSMLLDHSFLILLNKALTLFLILDLVNDDF
jgi:hypothetical protein